MPLSVNVEIEKTMDGKPLSDHRKAQLEELTKLTIVPDKIVLPLTDKLTTTSADDFSNFWYSTGDLVTPAGSIMTAECFDYFLSFAMTSFKAQGRTMDCLVVDLTKRPYPLLQMTYASVFVVLSRATKREDIRLLYHPDTSFEDSFGYLQDLKPLDDVSAFYHGYEETTEGTGELSWNWEKALTYNKS